MWKDSQAAGHSGPVDREEARPAPGISKVQIQHVVKIPSWSTKQDLWLNKLKAIQPTNSSFPPANTCIHTYNKNGQ